ncbi:flavodoxin [Geotalea uraniireducens]|uniref:Flavodoxin n=1 Tax=Geotalea uraniireducens TaxID=351604 RepID=A0ABN6VPC8_9BACT|nr:flavodoxin [Geotalea uraniireducens]BDV42159.1 flavodoxin [Geotalea uraniireducens]
MNNERNTAERVIWNVLTVCYSHSGNTRECARLVHAAVGGDFAELIPATPYPGDYTAVVNQAKRELQAGYKPALQTSVAGIEAYDVIFVGSPNWWNTIAPPVMTFLSTYDLAGKAIVPFITHGGGGLGRSVTEIARLCPQSTVLEGLAVRGEAVKAAQPQLAKWLRKLDM